MSRLLKYETLRNIRDLGGMRTGDGRVITSGKLIRSGHLSGLSEGDIRKLSELVDTIVDFRTDGEISEKPDEKIPSARYIHIPAMDSLAAGITREENALRSVFKKFILKPAEAKRYMCDMYRTFAESDNAVSQYASFLRILSDGHEKAVLWHCTAGKDRAGIAAVIVEELLGVPRGDIIDDYLMTNTYLRKDIQSITAYVKNELGAESDAADEALHYLLGADEEYIAEYYDAVNRKYGDYGNYIRTGLGVSEDGIAALRSRYCE